MAAVRGRYRHFPNSIRDDEGNKFKLNSTTKQISEKMKNRKVEEKIFF